MNPTMPRKFLFVLFSDDACRQNHAFMYALDLHAKGYQVRVLLEGPATALINALNDSDSHTGELLRRTKNAGLLAGACARASQGCATADASRNVHARAEQAAIQLLGDMDGHAAIEPFLREGYEMIAL